MMICLLVKRSGYFQGFFWRQKNKSYHISTAGWELFSQIWLRRKKFKSKQTDKWFFAAAYAKTEEKQASKNFSRKTTLSFTNIHSKVWHVFFVCQTTTFHKFLHQGNSETKALLLPCLGNRYFLTAPLSLSSTQSKNAAVVVALFRAVI